MRCYGKFLHKLHGFHHDYLGAIKRNGIVKLTDITQHAHGFYEAKIWYKGKSKFSGFFPDAWNRERVMQAITEALQDNNPLLWSNKHHAWQKIGTTSEGVKVLVSIDNSGLVKTAYPIFR